MKTSVLLSIMALIFATNSAVCAQSDEVSDSTADCYTNHSDNEQNLKECLEKADASQTGSTGNGITDPSNSVYEEKGSEKGFNEVVQGK